jgi:methylenetetrahydrofolate reductase (NADPH)
MLWQTVDELMGFDPTLITCTYGAGGSTQTKTLEVLDGVLVRYPTVAVASHLTCVGRTTDQLREYLREAQQRGVTSIVALRGDPPQGETTFTPIANGLHYAVELVALIKQEFPELRILVAGYPETHQEAVSPEADLEHLKEKCNAGGDTVVTQLFYDNTDFFRFRDRCSSIGITKPIIPGLMPVTNFKQIKRIATLCKARLPNSFTHALEKAGDDADAQFEAGVDYASKQAEELLSNGIPGMHLYVLNKSPAAIRVLEQVGMTRP